jgi:hypothetical protein
MGEIRLEATVIGPGSTGLLKVSIGRGQGQFVADVQVDRLPDSLRSPNSQFVVVVEGREVIRVEPAGAGWLEIQDQIRSVLNNDWDPIGVADDVPDEYDSYIGVLYGLLHRETEDEPIVHLRRIETEWMGIPEPSCAHLRAVVAKLRRLKLPMISAR